ncbi:MAG: hypothetical protein MJ137_08760 [Clostridia bacterium]|nr:hypothetical protein [Clostridia bacterium]
MKNTLKLGAVILLLAMLLSSFAACTGNGAETTAEAGTSSPSVTDEISSVISDITSAITEVTTAPESTTEKEKTPPAVIVPDEILPAVLYYTVGQRMANVTNGKVYRYNYVEGKEYYLTSSLTAQDPGFPLVIYFDASNMMIGTQFMNTPSMKISAEEDRLYVPSGTSYIYVNARGVDAVMHDSSDKPQTEPVTTEARTEPEPEPIPNFIAPDEIKTAVLYYTAGQRMANVANGKVFVYKYAEGRDYYLTSSLTAQDAGFPLVIYFDASDKMIGTQFVNTPTKRIEAVEDKLNVPAGTAYIYVNARAVDAVMVSAPDTPAAPAEKTKSVSILFVGNSLTQDAVAYLPYILFNKYPEIDFKFYMWYCGGFDLTKTYDYFINGTACDIFSVSENKQSWSNSSRNISAILSDYTFDIVCLQEYFNYKDSFSEGDLAAWNNCRDYITKNYKGKNELRFVTLFHAPLRSKADSVYNLTDAGCRLILDKTVAESVIAPGIAVKNALGNDLKKLGDVGGLSPDGTHTQEGLPCLLQTYVVLQWLLDRLGLDSDISGLDVRITSAVYNKLNVPGANPGSGVVPGTDAENKLALETAIAAYKQAVARFAAK